MRRAVIFRRAGWVLLGTVEAVLLLTVAALLALRSEWGGGIVRDVAVPRVNRIIAGHLDVDGFRFRGRSLELTGVTLLDPEGEEVARVGRVFVAFSPLALLKHRVDVAEVLLEAPVLKLERTDQGLNLARAVAPRKRPAPAAPGEPAKQGASELRVDVGALRIREGAVRFRDLADKGLPPLELEAIESDGGAQLAFRGAGTPEATASARLALAGKTRSPVRAPLSLALSAGASGPSGRAELDFRWGGSRLALQAHSQTGQGGRRDSDLRVEQIRIEPALVRAFVPDYPIIAPVEVTGTASLRGSDLRGRLALAAAGARGQLDAQLDLQRQWARRLALAIDNIDLARLVRNGPPSRFDVKLDGEGGGREAANLTGEVTLAVAPGAQMQGRPFGPVRARARAERGSYALDELLAVLPGLRVTGKGQVSPEALDLDLEVRAQDLRQAARSLGAPPALKLAGRGVVSASVRGTPEQPVLHARAQVPRLRLPDAAADQLSLDVRVEGRQLPLDASARLRAGSLVAGGKRLGAVALSLDSRRSGGFALAAEMQTPSPLAVRAQGTARRVPAPDRPGSQQIFELSALSLTWPRSHWQLARPVRLAVGEGTLALSGLDLRGDAGQRLQASLRHVGAGRPGGSTRVEGQLVVQALALDRLPALLVPPARKLAGRVDADVRLAGRLPRPDVDLKFALADGRLGKVKDVTVKLEARHRRGRASGTLAARALGAEHQARFDLPAAWPPPAAAALQLDVKLGEVDLHQTLALLELPVKDKIAGRASLALALRGQGGDPDLTLAADARGLRIERETLGDVTFRLRDPRGAPLAARLEAHAFGERSEVRLESPVVLARWLRRPPDGDQLMQLPFTLRATVPRLPLAAITARPGRQPPALAGVTALEADLRGPLAALRGRLAVDAQGVRAPGLPPTDGNLRVKLGDATEGVDARLHLSRRGQGVAELQARVGASARQLLGGSALGRAPLEVDARVGPLLVQRVALPAETGYGGPRLLRAQIDGRLRVRGTLDDPTVGLQARVAGAQLGGKPLGAAELKLDYRDARPVLAVRVDAANGGRLQLDAAGKADLSLAGLRRGLQVQQIPLTGSLTARTFDLGILSGLSDTVRAVAGLLEGAGQLSGTVGTPQLAGQLSWKDGRLLLAGYGEFRDIQLALKGDHRQMQLERLFARSGAGSASLWARATRQPDGRQLAVEGGAKLERFRLYTEGQPMGALSLDASASGKLAPDRIGMTVKIPEAHFELAEGKRKKLQPLQRPADVVVLMNGRPRDRREERKQKALAQRTLTGPPPAPDQTAASPGGRSLAAVSAAGRVENAGTEARKPPAEQAPPLVAPRPVRIRIEAARNLWVRGPDVNLELGLEPDFVVVKTDEARVFGTVKVRRGFVALMGKRFDVAPGSTVVWSGPPERPRLAVDASHRAERAGVTVAVHIEGPADQLAFTLRSPEHAEYGDSELLSLVVTGRLPDESGAGAAPGSQAASMLGNLLADRLQKALARRLPLDVLTLEPGQDLQGARLEAGTYLGDDFYVAYVGRMGTDPFLRENRNELHLEYQLSSRWSFEASYGDARRGSADLLWTKNY